MLNLYNSLTKQTEPFQPQKDEVTLYVCGITPYDTTHLGHAFTYAAFDVLIRYLEYQGHRVRYVQNVTDIDDDILRKAGEVEDDWQALGNRWTAHFIRDLKSLNLRPPHHFPRATDFIKPIIETVAQLVENEVAYVAGGSVYFQVDAWDEYGKMSELSRSAMLETANERGNNPDDPHKRNPLDFVLWQAQAPGEPAWTSPWGPGRPGWHIECSTMATTLLGPTIDIHGGGADLLFPHHESEIAQAECASGHQPFARFWMHTAMVRHEGEKMSKSLGNLVMVRDLLEHHSPDALRIYLSQQHYRRAWEHDDDALTRAQERASLLRRAATSGNFLPEERLAAARHAFERAMNADLDTAAALDGLERLATDMLATTDGTGDPGAARSALAQMASIFGLRLDAAGPAREVAAGWDRYAEQFSPDADDLA